MKNADVHPINKKVTANYLLSAALSRIEEIEGVVIAINWKDGTTTAGWSDHLNSKVSLALHQLQSDFLKSLEQQCPGCPECEPEPA